MKVIKKVSQEAINELVRGCLNLPQVETPVKHNFSDGVYVREIFMPGDTFVIGKKHTTKHLNIVQQGECLVYMEGELHHIVAPCTFESNAGVQKVLKVVKDTVWSTVHVTEETDIDKLESTLAYKTMEEESLCQWHG